MGSKINCLISEAIKQVKATLTVDAIKTISSLALEK
uniref:Uncharacterized protein n=1 Tax=Lepeophtheirus salmonis TaxID=72036 RepID=A0A0K2UNY8_LEPSM